MKSILIIVFIAAIVGASHALSLYSFETSTGEERASGICYEPNKVICSQDCSQVFLCVMDENDWSPIMIEDCTNDTYCNGEAGTCEASLSTCSPTDPPVFQLQCTATGYFPDPYDCTVYHECPSVGNSSTPTSCPAGWSYNALTTECDHSMKDGVCFPSGAIPRCTVPGQSGAVPENTNIYYVCVKDEDGLVYELFKCAHGGHFSNGECTEHEVTTPEETTIEVETTVVTTEETTVVTTEVPTTLP